jgi:ABC-2 type transport system ATP-binding protein
MTKSHKIPKSLKVEVVGADGRLELREVVLDEADTAVSLQQIFANEQIVTVHSEEATLEDIFIEITGRGLS